MQIHLLADIELEGDVIPKGEYNAQPAQCADGGDGLRIQVGDKSFVVPRSHAGIVSPLGKDARPAPDVLPNGAAADGAVHAAGQPSNEGADDAAQAPPGPIKSVNQWRIGRSAGGEPPSSGPGSAPK